MYFSPTGFRPAPKKRRLKSRNWAARPSSIKWIPLTKPQSRQWLMRRSRRWAISIFRWPPPASPTALMAWPGGPQYHQPKIVAELDFAEWRKVLSINLDGVFLTCRAVAAAMIKARKGGRIINIASTAARIVEVGLSAYGVSKAGVWMLTRVMAAELAPYNITVNAIGPGLTKTPMTTNIIGDEDDPAAMRAALNRENQVAGNHLQRVLLNRFGEPLDVANTALFLASEEGSYFTGSILHPDGGIVLA